LTEEEVWIVMNKKTNSLLVRSVIRACDVLKCLQSNNFGNDDIARRTKINKVTVHRIIKTLKHTGFVSQDPINEKYHLGLSFLQLARQEYFSHQLLELAAHQVMVQLCDLTGESVHVAVMSELQKKHVLEVRSKHPIQFVEEKLNYQPLQKGAAGEVLLAQLDDKEIALYVKSIALNGDSSVQDKKGLIKEINKVREAGYANTTGEVVQGVTAIAVPIRNYILPAALYIAGPDTRFGSKMQDFLVEILKSRDLIEEILDFSVENDTGGKTVKEKVNAKKGNPLES
jgi:IclR family KDG regulon transcriptional repressor